MKSLILIWSLIFSSLLQAYPVGVKGAGQTGTTYPSTIDFGNNAITTNGSSVKLTSSSPKNYITATDGSKIGAWTTFADGTGSTEPDGAYKPIDGTGGASTVTFAVSTDSSLRGTTNFLFTHTAASNAGNGFSYDFTIDPSDKGKVLQISTEYLISSGTYADDDLRFWIYDGTSLIQPAPYKLKNSGIIEKFAMEFQASQSTSYRLIAVVANATSTAYTIRFSNWNLGAQAKLYGSAVTDWVAYTPTFTGFGAVSINEAFYKRVGDSIYIKGRFTSGVSTTAAGIIGFPSGLVVDGNKETTASLYGGQATNQSSTTVFTVIAGNGSSGINLGNAASSGLSGLQGISIATNGQLMGYITGPIPIQGWSSSQVMSSDADTRIISFMGYVSTNQVLAATITNLPLTSRKDTHGAWTGSTYIVPSPGDYLVGSFLTYTTASSADLAVFKNGVIFKRLAAGVTYSAGQFVIGNSTLEDLKAGDIISVRSANFGVTVASDTSGFVSISKISGPSQIAASESVSALYTGAPPTGTLGNANNLVTYGTRVKDSHNSYNTSTGIYTVPVSGTYNLLASFKVNGTYALNGGLYCYIYINNILTYASANIASGAVGTSIATCTINSVPLLSGATVSIYSLTSASTPVFDSTAAWNFFSITRTGQY